MDIRSLRPASDFAQQYGVKALLYGPPGSGKTPIINTAPRPLLLACEPGLLSMRGSKVPTFQAYTSKLIDDFFDWFFKSQETKNFDALAIDSTTQMAEIYLAHAETTNKHGLAAYGEMSRNVMKQLGQLYFTQNKHTYLISKEEIITDGGLRVRRPYHPGKELPVKIPHMYDVIARLDKHNVPGVGQVQAFRCIGSIDEIARNRTGMLAEFEPPDFSKLVQKAMS